MTEQGKGLRLQPEASSSLERRAPIEQLSPIKQRALVACLRGDGIIYKRLGAWIPLHADPHEGRISGITVSDLRRDGLLTINVTNKQASARLTPRGAWFARTAANALAAV
jgi:hypothetical protein